MASLLPNYSQDKLIPQMVAYGIFAKNF